MNVFLCTADDHDVVSFITHSLTPPKDSQVLIITTTVTYTPCTPSNHTQIYMAVQFCVCHINLPQTFDKICVRFSTYYIFFSDMISPVTLIPANYNKMVWNKP